MTHTPDNANCSVCGQPMPPGESMFKFHGHSGPCPTPSMPEKVEQVCATRLQEIAKAFHDGPLMADDHEFVTDSGQGKWCVEVAQFFATAFINSRLMAAAPRAERLELAYTAAAKALAGTSSDIGAGELERVVEAILDAVEAQP